MQLASAFTEWWPFWNKVYGIDCYHFCLRSQPGNCKVDQAVSTINVSFFHLSHVGRSINKKLLKASQEKGCETIKDWMRGVRNHLYWCVTKTMKGFENLLLANWRSFMHHISNKHKDHLDALFTECAHGSISPTKWIKIGNIFSIML